VPRSLDAAPGEWGGWVAALEHTVAFFTGRLSTPSTRQAQL